MPCTWEGWIWNMDYNCEKCFRKFYDVFKNCWDARREWNEFKYQMETYPIKSEEHFWELLNKARAEVKNESR